MNIPSPRRLIEIGWKLAKNLTPSARSRGLRAKSPSFQSLFPAKARILRVATGFRFTEGPLWNSQGRYLIFSDIPGDTIFKVSAEGKVTVFRKPSGHSNGLTFDREGRLLACEHGNRRLTRTEHDGSVNVIAATFRGKKLNSPNDVVVKSDGSIYFTDPPYGIKPAQQELAFQGVYKIVPDRGLLTLLTDDFEKPNGLAFSPDERRLYIDDSSERRHIRVFDLQADGGLTNGKVFHDMDIEEKGSPDGMKVDQKGNLFCTGPGGIWVFDPWGQHLGTIVTPEKPANCAWGDEDLRTLYITAKTSVYSLRVNIPGIPCSERKQ